MKPFNASSTVRFATSRLGRLFNYIKTLSTGASGLYGKRE